ncbi:C9orf85 [Caligus rogercresseyi]|nr:C9orf85 [Caligus rogercresseyi]
MNLVVSDHCCPKCSGVIQWKIDYGKYKPLSRPGKCVRCQERRIKQAYHTLCENCTSEGGGLCAKCGESWSKEEDGDEDIEEDT